MLGDRNGCTPVHEGEKGVGCYGGLGRGGGGRGGVNERSAGPMALSAILSANGIS